MGWGGEGRTFGWLVVVVGITEKNNEPTEGGRREFWAVVLDGPEKEGRFLQP